jgi:glycosyltransferase involved in cell wall biosynthesis
MCAQLGPRVSVVTPVYNAEAYLADCIRGVLRQSYDNFEYVIVDNRSTDGTPDIAMSYAKDDPRVRVVRNEQFLDQSSNFNRALSLMDQRSIYFKFAFADDLILPSCVFEMVQVAESDPEVAVVGAYETFGLATGSHGIPFGLNVISGREVCRAYLKEGRYVFGSPNSLLYRTADARRRAPFFQPDHGYFEDADVCFDLLRTRKFGFAHQVLTFTRRDNDSTISSIDSFRPFLLMELFFIHRYGNDFLTPDEYERRWGQKLKEYFRFLGESVLARPGDREFWAFHRLGMEKIGLTSTRGRIALGTAKAILDGALNPKSSVERQLRRALGRS